MSIAKTLATGFAVNYLNKKLVMFATTLSRQFAHGIGSLVVVYYNHYHPQTCANIPYNQKCKKPVCNFKLIEKECAYYDTTKAIEDVVSHITYYAFLGMSVQKCSNFFENHEYIANIVDIGVLGNYAMDIYIAYGADFDM